MEYPNQTKSIVGNNVHIIATSTNANKISKTQWIGYALIGILILVVSLWMTFAVSEVGIFLLLLYGGLITRLIINDYRNRKNPFVAYEDNGQIGIDFIRRDNNNVATQKCVRLEVKNIAGFTLHSFFKMKPSFIELEEKANDDFARKVMIPLEDLSKQEAQKLIYYFESILPNKAKRISKSEPNFYKETKTLLG